MYFFEKDVICNGSLVLSWVVYLVKSYFRLSAILLGAVLFIDFECEIQ